MSPCVVNGLPASDSGGEYMRGASAARLISFQDGESAGGDVVGGKLSRSMSQADAKVAQPRLERAVGQDVSPEVLTYLRRVLAADPSVDPPTPLAATVQQELERLLHTHLTFCLGRELKSYAFLHL